MNRQRFVRTATLFLLLSAVFTADNTAMAQVKPFQINGGGRIVQNLLLLPNAASEHFAIGRGTAGLGRYNGVGAVLIVNPVNGQFAHAVPFQFTKNGNGDVLAFHYGRTDAASGASPPAQNPGTVMVIPVGNQGMFKTVWLAEFNPVPSACTGKFANVIRGSFMMRAESEPFFFGVTPGGNLFIPGGTSYSWEGRNGWIEFANGKY